jgi:16S rRNA (guanine527-N7)-methyltransferase
MAAPLDAYACALDALSDALEVRPARERRAMLVQFCALVDLWNARMNLTAARGAADLVEVLCADALVLADAPSPAYAAEPLLPRGARVIDVGTGAGAPALPLALLRDDLTLTCVEPLRKRVTFLRTAIGSLPGLAGRVRVREQRLDLGRPEVGGGPFDVSMARATFSPERWLPVGLALAPRCLVMTAQEPTSVATTARVVAQRRYALPRPREAGGPASRVVTAYEHLPVDPQPEC